MPERWEYLLARINVSTRPCRALYLLGHFAVATSRGRQIKTSHSRARKRIPKNPSLVSRLLSLERELIVDVNRLFARSSFVSNYFDSNVRLKSRRLQFSSRILASKRYLLAYNNCDVCSARFSATRFEMSGLCLQILGRL